MKKLNIASEIFIVSCDELLPDEKALLLNARNALKGSYSPYSNFTVGASIRTKNGLMLSGSNQENASYGLALCAERNVILHAFHMGYKADIAKIAITARPKGAGDNYIGLKPVAPCGACRQVMKEAEDLAGVPITIIFDCFDNQKIIKVIGIESLLPMAFGPKDLGINL